MFRGTPTRISPTSRSRMRVWRRATKSANGSAGMNSRGVASVRVSSEIATPTRLVPGAKARMRMGVRQQERTNRAPIQR